MKVVIMRHGEAERCAISDAVRPLTQRGWQQSMQMAAWLQQQYLPLETVLVSPYWRAQQTFEAVQRILPHLTQRAHQLDLTPYGNVLKLVDDLMALMLQDQASLLLIAHLPLVSRLVMTLCNLHEPPLFVPSALAVIALDPMHSQGRLQCIHAPQVDT